MELSTGHGGNPFWRGASEMDDIWFWDLKEENIAILGAEKPDENRG